MGFRVGALKRKAYKTGDLLEWPSPEESQSGAVTCRPEERPSEGNIKTVGYFNCDNPKCASWQDCFPSVQMALITISAGRIEAVEPYDPPAQVDQFAIIEAN